MKFKHIINLILVISIFSLILMPATDAWSWKTHSDIADVVYYGLPVEVQQKLDLNTLRDGSNDPDEKFHDFTYHSYPKSYEKAKSWLDQGKQPMIGEIILMQATIMVLQPTTYQIHFPHHML